MIKILHVITGLGTGGAEHALEKLILHQKPEFLSVVISLSDIGEVGQRIAASGVEVRALGMQVGLPDPIKFLKLVKWIREVNPEIVSTWLYHADLMGGLAARFAGTPSVVWGIRSSVLPANKTKLTTRLIVRLCAYISKFIPTHIICNSMMARNIHIDKGYRANLFKIIPNGCNLSQFKPNESAYRELRSELGLSKETHLVGLIARFDPFKNHKGFIEAAGRLKQVYPETHFVLAGCGVDWNNNVLVEWVKNVGMENRVHLLGFRRDIPYLTAAFDVATCCSWSEAFPNVVCEAMACGVPCVVTDVGDSAFIVGDTGFVVPPGDSVALAGAWSKMLSMVVDERLVLGALARKRVADNFEISMVVRQFEELFRVAAKLEKQQSQE